MEFKIGDATIEIKRGDITDEKVDAIVNAANNSLLGGGGVDGAIHRRGGGAILEQCRKLNGCATGDAKITTGGNLPAKYVIHTVGPVYRNGSSGEAALLKSAYKRSMEVASENKINSIAFPSISTGVYSYPIGEASKIALQTVADFIKTKPGIAKVVFVLFSDRDLDVYAKTVKELKLDEKK